MAYINRLSDINNKLDISIVNQQETNLTLSNIDDNIETTRVLTTNINSAISNNSVNVNISNASIEVSGSVDCNLKDGNGTSITSTTVDTKNGIDTNIINSTLTVNTISGFATETTLTSTNTKLDTINTSVNASILTTNTTLTTTNNTLSTINQGIGFNFQGNVYGNVCSNVTINANSFSTAFTWTRGDYKCNSILSYYDTSTAITDSISIFTTATNGTNLYLGTAYPINIGNATGRYYCFTLNLLPYNSISIRNNSTSNITGVYATLTSA